LLEFGSDSTQKENEPMVKVIAMMKRAPGVSPAEFARYWGTDHAALGFRVLPEDIHIRGYVQNYAVRSDGDQEPEFDGVVEFYLDDMAAFRRWLGWFMSDEGKALRDDEPNFMDASSVKVVVTEENVIIPRGGSRP
jgi:uncharacterized protein (TIGR02118 family)